ncbi:MAG: CBS domain-containing protein [Betaproteobacteria bacterium HGW-Betaproteobacteria-1]|nr:MAG: CBS domain-containing protein [Betaproteobacteria bacterium HGW-Betaproteobacteria-1]
MPMSELCNAEVITVERNTTVTEACKRMRQNHVGAVVVMDSKNGKTTPVGIVTDRDVVVELVATELDPDVITVGDIMVPSLTVINKSAGLFEAIRLMADKGVRRLPVVDDDGTLCGIMTLDDILLLLAEELGALNKLVEREQKSEAKRRR